MDDPPLQMKEVHGKRNNVLLGNAIFYRNWNVHLLFIVGLKWCLKLTYQKENNNNN